MKPRIKGKWFFNKDYGKHIKWSYNLKQWYHNIDFAIDDSR
jgi:hypothetical protein